MLNCPNLHRQDILQLIVDMWLNIKLDSYPILAKQMLYPRQNIFCDRIIGHFTILLVLELRSAILDTLDLAKGLTR